MEEPPLLADIKVEVGSGLDKLKQLVEAAQEVLIKEEEGTEKSVPVGLEFMLQVPTSGEDAYSQLPHYMVT